MGLNIFFLEDIRNAILAANEASSATAEAATSQSVRILDLIAQKLRRQLPEDTSQVLLNALHAAAVGNVDRLNHYRQGYRAALVTVSLAFGIAPHAIISSSFGAQDRPIGTLDEGEAGSVLKIPGWAEVRDEGQEEG